MKDARVWCWHDGSMSLIESLTVNEPASTVRCIYSHAIMGACSVMDPHSAWGRELLGVGARTWPPLGVGVHCDASPLCSPFHSHAVMGAQTDLPLQLPVYRQRCINHADRQCGWLCAWKLSIILSNL